MRRIYARTTSVKLLTAEEALEFLAQEHRQGAPRIQGKGLCLGLYAADELVAVVVFCSPRTSGMKKLYTSELLRLAFKHDVRVVGGASKLIKHYIDNFKPSDFFTYQDTTGETTNVYEAAGMTLVRAAKRKQYLVAPGKTRATAGKRECYSMASVVMRGPDALLGTKLGEVLRTDGTRKTNPELFLEELGWHIEETSGDRVYEWVASERTYYTYKITATDSEKYYYGVSHVKKANATVEDCLNDGYMGSGGRNRKNKFHNWQKKHETNLRKEILGLYRRAAEAYAEEEALVGKSYRDDPLALNSTAGGKDGGLKLQFSIASDNQRECPKHGTTKHQGANCYKCSAESRYELKECAIHGLKKHTKRGCFTCAVQNSIRKEKCPTHGETAFKGGQCVACVNSRNIKIKTCATHGKVKHLGGQCYRCTGEAKKGYTEGFCAVHGETTFRGSSCAKCQATKAWVKDHCDLHGETLFNGGQCQTCRNLRTLKSMECPEHGTVKTQNGQCPRCLALKLYRKEHCPTHGETTFRKGSCIACGVRSKISTKECREHGLTIHQGEVCARCTAQRGVASRKRRKAAKEGDE